MKINLRQIILIFSVLFAIQIFAAEKQGQARLFLGSTSVEPKQLNTELTAQSLKNVDLNNQAGVEITFPVASALNVGLRYSKRLISQDEKPANSNTDYKIEMSQDIAAFVARVTLFKSEFIIVDGMIGVGGSNSLYKIKTASQDGELKKEGSPFASAYSTAGISLGLGKDKYFFTLEAGIDSNKVEKFKRSGTMNTNVQNIDLSGGYFVIGFMFDGIPIFTK